MTSLVYKPQPFCGPFVQVPAVRLVRLGEQDMKKFVPESSDITQEGIDKFVQDYLDGKLRVSGVIGCQKKKDTHVCIIVSLSPFFLPTCFTCFFYVFVVDFHPPPSLSLSLSLSVFLPKGERVNHIFVLELAVSESIYVMKAQGPTAWVS